MEKKRRQYGSGAKLKRIMEREAGRTFAQRRGRTARSAPPSLAGARKERTKSPRIGMMALGAEKLPLAWRMPEPRNATHEA